MKLYAVVDVKAGALVATFNSSNDETAKRSFISILTGPTSVFTDFPEDFALYPLAEISFESNNLVVSAHGSENLRANGFNVKTFTVSDRLTDGVTLGKDYLAFLKKDRDERFNVVTPSEQEVAENE